VRAAGLVNCMDMPAVKKLMALMLARFRLRRFGILYFDIGLPHQFYRCLPCARHAASRFDNSLVTVSQYPPMWTNILLCRINEWNQEAIRRIRYVQNCIKRD
jgi:hypothetical protein